jgi:hypothetical protein
METAIRTLVLASGAQGLGAFMTAVGTAKPETPVLCRRCSTRMRGTGPKTKRILTLLGPTVYTRLRYCCPACGAVRYPADEALDSEKTSRSPGVRRQVARLVP